ncbi:LuxR family transcriptional regulator [Rhodophyticola sp. CCM32]|uniref:response regulator transcription factor n=1 Tax=Rhodophyticola sp. CCM32 TaxID=2916397 RepID=UPI00107F0696|nr:LuxR family transcriptional regulator [Rhodophyticola sp. CCM32]QBY00015.1 LuxR family transcriptional regulator [Rhodophyticola sp. CCM32]
MFDQSSAQDLREALKALSAPDSSAMAWDAIPALGRLADAGHHVEIDLTATKLIGAPVIIAHPQSPVFDALTPRQRDVAQGLAQGLSNKDIARTLGISPATVKDHVHAILKRLGLSRRGEVAASIRQPKA